jgi:hypothetical protein
MTGIGTPSSQRRIAGMKNFLPEWVCYRPFSSESFGPDSS